MVIGKINCAASPDPDPRGQFFILCSRMWLQVNGIGEISFDSVDYVERWQHTAEILGVLTF
jgi:hypothetical protein